MQTKYKTAAYKPIKKTERELVLAVSMFLLAQEPLRKLFWNVKSVHYDRSQQQVSIGISTITGKLGTTLAKLRKTSRDLSDHLYDHGLTFRQAKVTFFVDKQEEDLERVNSLLATIERIEKDMHYNIENED